MHVLAADAEAKRIHVKYRTIRFESTTRGEETRHVETKIPYGQCPQAPKQDVAMTNNVRIHEGAINEKEPDPIPAGRCIPTQSQRSARGCRRHRKERSVR